MTNLNVEDGGNSGNASRAMEAQPDLNTLNFDQLVAEKDRLIRPYSNVSEMTTEELERFSAICDKLRMTARPAGKPAGSGTRRKAAAKSYTDDEIL
jgi:hypothetical protein